MSVVFDFVVGSAVILFAVSAFLFLILVMRNPFVPRWVHDEFSSQIIALLMIICAVSALAFGAHAYQQAGMGIMQGFGTAIGVAILAVIAFCWVSRFRARLERASQGFSPFASLGRTPHLPGQGAGTA